tara:strand:+ start:347 stop:964 length:618 start_codon:yes stop_codon:yes gene_type:complete
MIRLAWADVESTGLDPYTHKIVEIAVIAETEDGGIIPFHRFIRHDVYPDGFQEAFDISGITIEKLEKDGVTARQAYLDFVAWLKQNFPVYNRNIHIMLAGHNILFDCKFIEMWMRDNYLTENDLTYQQVFTRPVIDTMSVYAEGLLQGKVPETHSFRLQTLCNKMGVKVEKFHSATSDAVASMNLYRKVWAKLQHKSEQLNLLGE